VCELAFCYGKHLGLAFQIVDDVLDFTSSSGVLGKPTLNDLTSGISTAPVRRYVVRLQLGLFWLMPISRCSLL